MADKKSNTFTTRQNSDQRRVSKQITESRYTAEPASPRAATSPVPHVVEAHRPLELEHTDRQTTNQNVQGEGGSQLVPGSSLNVVSSQGPVQLETGSTVINNPTYNDNSQHHHHHHHYHPSPYHPAYHNDYLRWVEQNAAALGSGPSHPQLPPCPVPQSRDNDQLEDQTSRYEDITDRNTSAQSQTERKTFHHVDQHGDKSSYHVPFHCKDCQRYHNNDHQPVAESRNLHQESESRYLGFPHHPLPQILPITQQSEEIKPTNRRGIVTDTRRRENAISKDREIENKKTRPSQVRLGQRSNFPRKPASDVTQNATRADWRMCNEAQTSTTADWKSNENVNTQTTPPAGTRPPSVSVTQDTVSVIDSKGQVLEPGDALWTEGPGYGTRAIYVGQQMLVRCDWEADDSMIKKEQLCMTAPFGKCRVHSDDRCQVYPPSQRVDRAMAWIGRRFTEGDSVYGSDFPEWIYTGMGWFEAKEKGFSLGY